MWLLAIVVVVLPPLVTALTARGPAVVLHVQTAKTSSTHPLHVSENVTLWCAPDNPQITIRRAWFVRRRDRGRFEAQLSPERKNATFTMKSPVVRDAGEYTCELDTQQGRLTTQIQVYGRLDVYN
uniref:Ig-like domain-containing protein n=1 Tax=Angiostrongylus cantonensis TaxID=6313 RepID=A0A0K0D1I5_ANGCA